MAATNNTTPAQTVEGASNTVGSNKGQAAGVSTTPARRRPVKPLYYKIPVFLLSLLPIVVLTLTLLRNELGPNPIEALEKETGEWSLRFLLLSLAMTPLAQLFKVVWPIRIRRMIGLFAFFYVCVHLLVYLWFDQSLDMNAVLEDVLKRPFITVGFAGFLILIPLAVTSNRWMIRKLKQRWHTLHRFVYLAALAAVVHYVWLAKGDIAEPVVYLAVLMVLLAYRVTRLLRDPS